MHNDWNNKLQNAGAELRDDRIQHYGDPEHELQMVHDHDVFADLSHYGLLEVTGPDAPTFLQGQITCDINDVIPTQSQLGACCNNKGRVLSVFQIFQWNAAYYLRMPLGILELTLQHLQQFVMFSEVTLTNASDQWVRIGLSGPNLPTLLSEQLEVIPDKPNDVAAQDELCCLRVLGRQPRFECVGTLQAVQELRGKLSDHVMLVGAPSWQLLNIRDGLPTIYNATQGKFTPHDLNLVALGGVNFEKGCYVGQEIVARMEHLGQLKQHLYHGTFASATCPDLAEGRLINNNDNPVGDLVDVVVNAEKQCEFLAVVKDQAVEDQQVRFTSLLGAAVTFIQDTRS